MSNITNINGEYVKFYYTTNSNLPKILKNTGSVIVLNKECGDYSYNEIWLADNFIGTGYGLANFQIKDIIDKYGLVYNETYTYLDDNNEEQIGYIEYDSYLDYRFEDIYNAYSYSLAYSYDLYNNIVENFISNYGDASNSYIVFNDTELKISYLPYLTHFAEYTDAQLNYTELTLKGLAYYNTNKLNVLYTHDNLVKDKFYLNSTEKTNRLYYLPIGSIISYIDIESNITLNDVSASYSQILATYIDNVSVSNNEQEISTYTNTSYVYSIPNEDIDEESLEHNVGIRISKNSYTHIFVNEGLQKIISADIEYKGTTNYSYYPLLKENTGIELESKELAIKPHKYNLGDIYVQGCFEITYFLTNTNNNDLHSRYLHPVYNIGDTYNYNYSSEMIINNKAKISLNYNVPSYLYIGVPTKYSIASAQYYNKSINVNGNDIITNYETYVNCTGDIYKDTHNGNNTNNLFCHLAYFEQDNSNIKYIKYNHYRLYLPTNNYINKTIYFDFKEENNQVIYSNPENLSGQLQNDNLNITNNFVQNEIYNAIHWLKPKDLTYIYNV